MLIFQLLLSQQVSYYLVYMCIKMSWHRIQAINSTNMAPSGLYHLKDLDKPLHVLKGFNAPNLYPTKKSKRMNITMLTVCQKQPALQPSASLLSQ
jgi:hypothetical protein